MIIGLNGTLVSVLDAHLPVNDRGLLLGDGLFETLYYDGQHLEEFTTHWQRLQHGLTLFEIPFDKQPGWVKQQINTVLEANNLAFQTASVRLTITRGAGGRGLDVAFPAPVPTMIIQVASYKREVNPIAVDFSKYCHAGVSVLSSSKHLGYQLQVLGRLEARKKTVDDVLFMNAAGQVVAATAANVFALIEGEFVTPYLDSGCLPGVKRQQVIQRLTQKGLPVTQRPLYPQELLEKAEIIFLTNSLIDIQPIRRIGQRQLTFDYHKYKDLFTFTPF